MRLTKTLILTDADIRRAILVLTCISVVISVLASSLVVLANIGFDLSTALPASKVMRDTLVISALLPAIICPLVVHRALITVRDLNLARAELDRMARTDALTGLLNRRGFDAAAKALLAEARLSGRPVGALICDIDHFKRINDTHGHDAGDEAIRQVAGHLAAAADRQAHAVVGRQGGEEFAIFVSGLTQRELAAFAESIRAVTSGAPVLFDGRTIPVTISIGLAIDTHDSANLPDLLRLADQALYRAKEGGRNRVESALMAA